MSAAENATVPPATAMLSAPVPVCDVEVMPMDSPRPTFWSPGVSVVKITQSAVFAKAETSCVVASQPSSVTVDEPCGMSVASSGRSNPSAVPNVYAWSPESVSVVPPETPSANRTGSDAENEAAPSRTSGFGTVPVPTASVAPS